MTAVQQSVIAAEERKTIATYITSTNTGTGATPSFASVSLGSERPDRIIVVGIYGYVSGGRSISAVTIGGVSATIIQTTGSGTTCGMAYALVPTGTTGTIAITWSGSVDRTGIVVYSVINTNGITTVSNSTTGNTSNPISVSINCPRSGAIIGFGCFTNIPTGATSWTGLTKDADLNLDANNVITGASLNTVYAQSSLSVTAGTASGSSLGRGMVVASWR